MMAATDLPLEHAVLPNIRWETFERILHDIGKTRRRIAYLDGNLELTECALWHHRHGRLIGHLIFLTALETSTPIRSGGSTTLKDSVRRIAIEPDNCFWIKHEAIMRGKKRWSALRNPPPDLAVEIDITASWVDRLEIYAGLNVPAIWSFNGEKLRVLALSTGGTYKERTNSVGFPSLPIDGFTRFVKKLGTADEVSLIREFRDWLRSKNANGERENGRR